MMYHNKPDFVAFSETWIKHKAPSFYNYEHIWNHRVGRPGGGLGFIVKRGIQFQELVLRPYANGVLETQAIKIFITRTSHINILSIYNPNKNVSTLELNHYVQQLGSRYLMVGDFNAHCSILGDSVERWNTTGRSLEEFLHRTDTVLNTPVNFLHM